MKPYLLGLTILFSLAYEAQAAPPIPSVAVGQWRGTASAAQEKTRLILDIREQDGKLAGSMSLPDVGVTGWPAEVITARGSRVTIAFPSDSGTQLMQLKLAGKQLTGQWKDPRNKPPGNITLTHAGEIPTVSEQRFAISGPDGVLGASLILPACPDKCPGVVMLHGSGPQSRDANRFAAQALADQGIAAFFFDKRGFGESSGTLDGVSFSDLADDAIAAAKVLAAMPQISRVGFSGHSQGGWIAPLAASRWSDTAFIVTSAGPAVPPAREAEWDVVHALRRAGLGERTQRAEAEARQVVRHFHDGIRSGDWQDFDAALQSAKTKDWYAKTPLNRYADRSNVADFANYRVFMDYDPLPPLQALKVPMLAILSPDDESIDAVETMEILREFVSRGKPIRLSILPGYDHSMRRIGPAGKALRWPAHPVNYFAAQAQFMHEAITTGIGK